MKELIEKVIFLGAVLCGFNTFGQTELLSIGEVHKVQSEILDEERLLNIYLPPSYSDTSNFPVVYLLDGSMNEDFLHIVGLMQFFNLQFGMPETIVVGISNVDRKRDFTFATNIKSLNKTYPTTGHSNKFIQFLEKELRPFIEDNFKISKTNYLIGQSLGGLLASEILINKPQMFNHYLIVSPSIWWDDQSLLKQVSSLEVNKDINAKVFISVGENEHKVMVKDATRLKEKLVALDRSKLAVDFEIMKGENHASILHQSVYSSLLKLFPLKK